MSTTQGYEVKDRIIISPGKFEGQLVDVLYWYEAAMDGQGEIISDETGNEILGERFPILDEDRDTFPTIPTDALLAVVWYDEQGFVTLEYVNDESSYC